MPHRVIATQTNDDLGLVEEEEVITTNEQLKEILVELGMAKFYDDTKPLPPKGLNDHENMSYPKDRYILKNDSMYKSNTTTSPTWVLSEWDIKITGANKI